MKNTINIIVAICAVICFAHCTKVREGGFPTDTDGYMELRDSMLYMELTVGEQTKTTIGASDYSVQWNTGDSIFVVSPECGCIGSLKTEQSGQSTKFTGMVAPWVGTQNIQFYYLGSGTLRLLDSIYTYDIKNQTGTLSDLSSNLQIMHGQIENITAGNGNLGNLTMKSLISIVKLDLLTKSDYVQAASAYCLAPAKTTLSLKDGTFSKALKDTIRLATPSTEYYLAVIPASQNFTFFQSGAEDIELVATSPLAANGFYTGSDNSSVFLEELDKGGYTESGWGYGEGVEINDLIWAPVNCGSGNKKEFKYGKLYQWGRIDGTGYNTGTEPYNVETVQTAVAATYDASGYNKTPNSNSFYTSTNNAYDWYTNASAKQLTSWPMNPSEAPEGSSGIGNPCPDGWRVPTEAELTFLMKNRSKWTTKSGRNGYYFSGNVAYSLDAKQIFLPAAGYRSNGGGFDNRTSQGRYWTSSVNGINGRALYFNNNSSNTAISNYYKAFGLSVRCVKEVAHSGPYVAFSNITFNGTFSNTVNDYKKYEFVDFNFTTNGDYEVASIPIKNLTVGQWYSITFGETITDLTSAPVYYGNTGSLSNSVRPKAVTASGASAMLSYQVSKDWFVWAKDVGVFQTANYTPTACATTVFKATAETMYWVWGISKLKDGVSYNCRISLVGDRIKPIYFASGAKADLGEATYYGWYIGGNDDIAKYGLTTYKISVDNQRLEMFTTAVGQAFEKLNIQLTGLTEGKQYKLTFDYDRKHVTSGAELAPNDEYDICCGISKDEITYTLNRTYHNTSTGDYTFKDNNLAGTYSDSLTFSATKDTMYWVWSMSKLKDGESFVQTLSNVKLTEVTTE